MCPSREGSQLVEQPWRPWEARNKPQLTETQDAPLDFSLRCGECQATFRRDSELRRHLSTVHAGNIVFCRLCDKGFTRKDNMTRHIKLAHSEAVKPSCKHCFKSLSRKDAVQRHEQSCSKNPIHRNQKQKDYTTLSHKQRLQIKLEKSQLTLEYTNTK